jgi:predicted AAA+ superfamily ATPase
VTFGVLWQGFHTPVLDHFLKVVQQTAQKESAAVAQNLASVLKKTGPTPARKAGN